MQSREPSLEDDALREPSNGMEVAQNEAMFTLFQFLPKECRLCIWDQALIPRLISLYRREDSTTSMELAYLSQASSEPVVIWIALACAESFRFVQKRYHEWELWDFRRDISNSLYSPGHDVVYFPYEFHAPTLLDLPLKYPDQTNSLRTLALPSTCQTIGAKLENDAMQVLEALHGFGGLRELVIVNTGKETDKQWMEGQKVWKLPEDIERGLKKLKLEKWPEWKIPIVRVVDSEENVLQC